MTTTCGTCDRPTRDAAYLCDGCSDDLARYYGGVPSLVEELEITLTRQKGNDAASGGGSGNPLPFNVKAGAVLSELRNELVTTIRLCVEENVRHSSPRLGLPSDDLDAMSAWLLWRVDGLALHPAGPDALTAMRKIEDDGRKAIDTPPARIYLGTCTAELDGQECGGAVYAYGESPQGKCRRPDCRTAYDTAASMAGLREALDTRLCTASEIARLSTYLGLEQPRDRVRQRVNKWHARGRIVPHGHAENGDPLFLYGDVRVMLAVDFDKREAS